MSIISMQEQVYNLKKLREKLLLDLERVEPGGEDYMGISRRLDEVELELDELTL